MTTLPSQAKLQTESIRQGLHTMRSIATALGWMGRPQESSTDVTSSSPPPQRYWSVGQWCDALDTVEQWLEGQILSIDAASGLVLIHYSGWPSRWDEWLPCTSPRLAPFRTHTAHVTQPWASSPLPVCLPVESNSKSIGSPPYLLPSQTERGVMKDPPFEKVALDVHLPYPQQRAVHVKVSLGEEDVRTVLPGIVEWGRVIEPLLQRLEILSCEQPKREARRAALMGGATTGAVYGRDLGFDGEAAAGDQKESGATTERLKDFQAGLDSRAEISALALQLAPLLERWGRILVDLAPSVEALARSPVFVPQSVDIQHSTGALSGSLNSGAGRVEEGVGSVDANVCLWNPSSSMPLTSTQPYDASETLSPLPPSLLQIPTSLGKHAHTHATREAAASGYCSLTRAISAELHWSSVRLPGYALPSQDGTMSLLRTSSRISGPGLATLGALLGGAVDVMALLEGITRLEAAATLAASQVGAGGGQVGREDTNPSAPLIDDPSLHPLINGGDPTGDVLGIGDQVGEEEEEEEVEESDTPF